MQQVLVQGGSGGSDESYVQPGAQPAIKSFRVKSDGATV